MQPHKILKSFIGFKQYSQTRQEMSSLLEFDKLCKFKLHSVARLFIKVIDTLDASTLVTFSSFQQSVTSNKDFECPLL